MARMEFCPFCEIEHESKWIIHRPIGMTCIIDWGNGCRAMAAKMKNSEAFIRTIDLQYEKDFSRKTLRNTARIPRGK